MCPKSLPEKYPCFVLVFFSLLLLFTFSKGLARATESGILISDTNVCRRRRTLRPRRATAPCSASRGWKCGRGGGGEKDTKESELCTGPPHYAAHRVRLPSAVEGCGGVQYLLLSGVCAERERNAI